MRRANGAAITPSMRRARKRIGKKITQWRKEQARTEATSSRAPAIIADLHRQLVAANQRVADLEVEVEEQEQARALVEEELESMRLYEAELVQPSTPTDGGEVAPADPRHPQWHDPDWTSSEGTESN